MTFVIRKLPNQNKYKVYNKITKHVHAYHSSKANAIKQVNILRHLSKNGEGVFSDVWNKAKDFSNKIIHGRNDYPPSVKAILNKYKHEKIVQVSLRRKELISLYGNILNIATNLNFKSV